MSIYILDIGLGNECNFRCKYCFEQKSQIAYTRFIDNEEIFIKTCEYIDFILNNELSSKDKLCITFYGGEPLLYIDKIIKFTNRFKSRIYKYNIVTNGYLLDKYLDKLLYIRSSGCSLKLQVSYDYYLQNKNRQNNTYSKIRDNIKLMHKYNFKCNTITVFPYSDLQYFDKVFFDILELKKELPKLNTVFNVDRSNISNTSFNKELCIPGFTRVKEYLDTYNLDNFLQYNGRCGDRTETKKLCMIGNIYAAIDIQGNIYPAYNVIYTRPELQKLIIYGTVFQDFTEISKYKNKLLSSLNFTLPDKCRDCNSPCRVFPWSTIKTSLDEFNGLPSEEHCEVHKFLHEYLG